VFAYDLVLLTSESSACTWLVCYCMRPNMQALMKLKLGLMV